MKLLFACFDYKPSNLRKQPWRYVDELTRKLDRDVQSVIITDCESDVEGIRVRTVSRLFSLTGPSDELVQTVQDEDPDVVAAMLGPSSFLRVRTLAGMVDIPTIGVMTSPLYDLTDLIQVGSREFFSHSSYLMGHVVGAVTPDRFVKRHLDQFDRVVTMTRSTRDVLTSSGTDTPINVVSPGIDPFDFELPPESDVKEVRSEIVEEDESLILYFTSPLTLRGTDTLVRAFARIPELSEAKLVILSRQDDGGLSDEEQYLEDLAEELGVDDSFVLLPRNLSPEGVKTYLRASDVVALPYKIVISGVPISILETMAMGTPVVTTTVDGLPELVKKPEQLVSPADPTSLSRGLQNVLFDDELREELGQQNREHMKTYDRWDDSRDSFISCVEGALND